MSKYDESLSVGYIVDMLNDRDWPGLGFHIEELKEDEDYMAKVREVLVNDSAISKLIKERARDFIDSGWGGSLSILLGHDNYSEEMG